ncbi:MAG: hypothetical protein ACJ714_14415 [Ornithinibacter sp.]
MRRRPAALGPAPARQWSVDEGLVEDGATRLFIEEHPQPILP